MNPVLHVEALSVERGTTTILRNLNWTVQRGEHWVILGPNGCGKSTLLKALIGYLSPSSGNISLLGQTYGESDWRELRLLIGIVTNSLQSSIPAAETAIETVVSGVYAQLDLWGTPSSQEVRAARGLLEKLRLDHLAERPWLYLSQGEKQRVLIARALAANPKLLILDEPCAGLDPVAREDFLEFVSHIGASRRSPTLVLVTHHVEEIVPCISHALLLREGAVLRAGPRKEVLTSAALRQLFGRPVHLRQRGGRLSLSVAPTRRYEST
jgi:iron complex transport system ATP-binding protein